MPFTEASDRSKMKMDIRSDALEHNPITPPEVAVVAITRVALGVGIGLLLGPKLNSQSSKAAGLALIVVGVATTVPLAIEIFGGRALSEGSPGRGKGSQRSTRKESSR